MPTAKYEGEKLKNESNYNIWSIRAEAFLIEENYIKSAKDLIYTDSENSDIQSTFQAIIMDNISDNINDKALAALKKTVSDGPLMHINNAKSLKEAWKILKNLYDKEGFSATFILFKRFFNITCDSDNVNNYIDNARHIINELETKSIKIPEIFINSWILEKLDKSFNDFKSNIYATLRSNKNAYTTEDLFCHIMDENRRKISENDSESENVLFTKNFRNKNGKTRYKNNNNGNKKPDMWCILHKNYSHNTANCRSLIRVFKKQKALAHATNINNNIQKESTKKPHNIHFTNEMEIDNISEKSDLIDLDAEGSKCLSIRPKLAT
jgi:hypothetical protein